MICNETAFYTRTDEREWLKTTARCHRVQSQFYYLYKAGDPCSSRSNTMSQFSLKSIVFFLVA